MPGQGVQGRYAGSTVQGGNSGWLGLEGTSSVKRMMVDGLTVFCIARDGSLLAAFGLRDSLRPEAKQVLTSLKQRGITIAIVSGDDTGATLMVAEALDIPADHVRSRRTPAAKQEYVQAAKGNGNSVVLFCGDGTNDAVALARADIGIHIDGGTDVAESAANVVLMRPVLSGVLVLLNVSRAAWRRITFNFLGGFIYNTFVILLAAGALVNARIPPQYAGLGEIVSVVPVVLVAMQLRWARLG